jgi:hypothetical protein
MAENNHLSPHEEPASVESLPPLTLTNTPGTMSPQVSTEEDQASWQTASSLSSADDRLYKDMRKSGLLHALNPYKLALNSQDLESCVALENSVFEPGIAASREKVG